jgi:hypothetical protein
MHRVNVVAVAAVVTLVSLPDSYAARLWTARSRSAEGLHTEPYRLRAG